MKRLKNWMHGMLWAVILGLGVYVMAKGIAIVKKRWHAGAGSSKVVCTGPYVCGRKRKTEKRPGFDLLTKELIPLTAYWESKSGGIWKKRNTV